MQKVHGKKKQAFTCLSGADSPTGETVKEQAFKGLLLIIQKAESQGTVGKFYESIVF